MRCRPASCWWRTAAPGRPYTPRSTSGPTASRAVYVDSGPLPDGEAVNAGLPGDDVEIPLPAWDVFEGKLDGIDEAGLARFRARAVPQPTGTARDPQQLSDARRYDVPVTFITSTGTEAEVREAAAQGMRTFAELPLLTDVTFLELPTGHWPMFSRPADLGAALVKAIG